MLSLSCDKMLFFQVCRIGLLFPFFSVAYITMPWTNFSQKLRKPFIKFICTSSSYFTFLCESQRNKKKKEKKNVTEKKFPGSERRRRMEDKIRDALFSACICIYVHARTWKQTTKKPESPLSCVAFSHCLTLRKKSPKTMLDLFFFNEAPRTQSMHNWRLLEQKRKSCCCMRTLTHRRSKQPFSLSYPFSLSFPIFSLIVNVSRPIFSDEKEWGRQENIFV